MYALPQWNVWLLLFKTFYCVHSVKKRLNTMPSTCRFWRFASS